MNTKFFQILVFLVMSAGIFNPQNAISQTAGSLTFNVTTTFTGGSWGARANYVCWIENSSGTFIKTRILNGGETDHLIQWTAKSPSQNTVDAIVGATTTTNPYIYSPIIWTGNDLTGSSPYNLLPDGTYSVAMELE